MPQTLDALLKAPTKEQIRDLLLKELQGVGFTRQSGFSPGAVTMTGQPNNAYQVRVEILSSGNLGVATFRWSTDGGATWSTALTVPSAGTFPIPGTALVIVFSEGPSGSGSSFLVGDVFSIDTRVPVLQASAWQTGSVPLSLVENDAAVLEDLYALVRVLGAGGFLETASGPWLDLLASNVYAFTRFPGVPTVGVVRLTDSAGGGPFTLLDGQVTVQATSGQRFTSVGAYTVPQAGFVDVTVRAEQPGAAYNVANNTITSLVTAIPGVLVSNPPLVSGTWVTTQGADEESDELLRLRCRNRWSTLGTGSPASTYDLWAKTADPTITRTRVQASPTVAGRVEVYLAGASGPAGPLAVSNATTYIQPRVPLTVTALVQAASAVNVPVTATLFVFSGFQTQALIDATAAVEAYFRSVDIGGTVYLTAIIEALMLPAGLRNVTVAAPTADVALTATQVAVPTISLSVVVV